MPRPALSASPLRGALLRALAGAGIALAFGAVLDELVPRLGAATAAAWKPVGVRKTLS